MQRIKIEEIDNTSAGTTVVAEDVVFVPGFVNADYISNENCVDAYVPTLCESVSDFELYFGETAAILTGKTLYGDLSFGENAIPDKDPSETFMAANTLDPGYIYAKELLTAGLPVYYVRVNEQQSDMTVQHMYEFLAQTATRESTGSGVVDIWNMLTDVGEYQEIKYLTTGGYPAFEYYDLNFAASSEDVPADSITFYASTFKEKAELSKLSVDTTYDFIYKYEKANVSKTFATEDELTSYLSKAEEGKWYYVTSLDKVYYVRITPATSTDPELREWVALDSYDIWALRKKNITEDTITRDIKISEYGLNVTPASVLEEGNIITVNVPINKTSTIIDSMLSCAANRGDCVVLVDHTNNKSRQVGAKVTTSVYYSVSNENSSFQITSNGEFGAMFTPWCTYSYASSFKDDTAVCVIPSAMPASFGYLKALATSLQSNANWLAIAGAARGAVSGKPNLDSGVRLTNAVADSYQDRNAISINAITNVKPYGYLIWGNRTLKNNALEGNLTATSFLNTRNMVSDIKKAAYIAARQCMFEQNSDVLWINYKGKITPILDNMVSGAGLSGYKLIKGTTSEKAKLVCTIRIYPLYAVENFDITVEMADDEVTVS